MIAFAVIPNVRLLCAGVLIVLGVVPSRARADDIEDPDARVHGRQLDTRWEFNSSLSGRKYGLHSNAPGSVEVDGMAERIGFELVNFLSPLRDDGAPYSLQRFLQRANSVSFDLDAGHFKTDNPTGFTPRIDWDVGVGGGVDFYARPWLNLVATVSYDDDALSDVTVNQRTHSYYGAGGVGLRAGDTLIRASYYAVEQQISGGPHLFRQGVRLVAFTAVVRRFTVRLFGETIPQGGDAEVALEYFRGRRLGLFGSALAGKGQFYRTGPAINRYVAAAGLSFWIDPMTGLLAQYALRAENQASGTQVTATDVDVLGYREVSHALLLQLFLRFP